MGKIQNYLLSTVKWPGRFLAAWIAFSMSMLTFEVYIKTGLWQENTSGFFLSLAVILCSIIGLVLSWKKPIFGAVIFSILGFFYLYLLSKDPCLPTLVFMVIPMFLTSVFFVLDSFLKKR